MGDMEDAEVRSLRRDAELDRYYDWLADFDYKDESRVTLISWLQFELHCVSCNTETLITKRGEHSYQGNCGHLYDRYSAEQQRAAHLKMEEWEAEMWRSQLYDCPYHLVRVSVQDWGQNWWNSGEWLRLSCNCKIDLPLERKPCSTCLSLPDGTMPSNAVVQRRLRVVEEHRDPTLAYELSCGHTVIDL